jgi:protein-tyrosine phosphatase
VPAKSSTHDPFTVLFVCTGNICRSALAERLGRAYLEDVLCDDASAISLASAGTHAVVDSAMHSHSARVLRDLGGEADPFRARQLLPVEALQADLILTMTREHRRLVLELAPGALHRTFTLREASDLVQLLDSVEPIGSDLAERARALVAEMAAARSRRGRRDDDVPDPIEGPLEAHRLAGELIAGTLIPLFSRIVALRGPAQTHPWSTRRRNVVLIRPTG